MNNQGNQGNQDDEDIEAAAAEAARAAVAQLLWDDLADIEHDVDDEVLDAFADDLTDYEPDDSPEEVLLARRNRLTNNYKSGDEAEDLDLLFAGPMPFDPDSIVASRNQNFETSQQSGGNGSILQRLAAIVEAQIGSRNFQRIVSMAQGTPPNEGFWKRSSRVYWRDFINWELESPNFRNLYVYSSIKGPPGPRENDGIWRNIQLSFRLLYHLRRLLRFVDKRNPETNVRGLPDGSNLEHPELRASWALHRAWIRALHYRSLMVGTDSQGWEQLQQILALSLGLLDWESNVIIAAKFGIHEEFRELIMMYDQVKIALRGFTHEVFSPTPEFKTHLDAMSQRYGGPVHYSATDVWNFNLRNDIFSRIYKNHFDHLGQIHLLYSQLLEHATLFEDQMSEEHIEDYLISKRVVVEDEEFYLATLIDDDTNRRSLYHPSILPKVPIKQEEYEKLYYPMLKKIAVSNFNRRNYLLLRDWSKRRPWKQLYCVFSTHPLSEGAPFDDLIQRFYKFMDNLNALPQPGLAADSPSRKGNIFASLFPIHPIASYGALVSRFGDNFSEPCVICQDVYKPGSTIVQLHCNHYLHWMCFLQFIDHPGRYQYTCPYCRTGGSEYPFLLHEKVGITPEVIDVWDNLDVTSSEYAEEHPDIADPENATVSDGYWINENAKLQMSKDWVALHGFLAPRAVQVELAHMRQNRREYNKLRRNELKTQGRGMQVGSQGFDPTILGDDEEADNTIPNGKWVEENGVLRYEVPLN